MRSERERKEVPVKIHQAVPSNFLMISDYSERNPQTEFSDCTAAFPISDLPLMSLSNVFGGCMEELFLRYLSGRLV